MLPHAPVCRACHPPEVDSLVIQENDSLHKKLDAAESARQAAMREMKDVADQCEAAKGAAVKLEDSERALRARVQELESGPDGQGVVPWGL